MTNIDTHKLSEEEAAEIAFEAGENVVDSEFLPDRFVLDEHDDVIDLIYHTGPKGSFHPQVDSRKDQQHLRERVLWRRLGPLVDGLIVNLQPQQIGHDGNEYQSLSIWSAIYAAICASSLNTLDPSISIQNRFDGTLRRQKESLQEVTSLSLFRDDIERLLRDLYGDIEGSGMDEVLRAVFCIAEEFTQWVRPDIYREHHNACVWDYIDGIGVPDGGDIGSSDYGRAYAALEDIRARVREVRDNPSAFGKYTVEFATRHVEEFIRLTPKDVVA